MADAERKLADGKSRIDFQTDPSRYRHWKLEIDGEVATLLMDVDEKSPLFEGYELKLNSYDLGVDIELADAIERLRFEQPRVKVILLRSAKPRVFCAGANIRMLAGATHAHKVNFCKFTNETRNGIEDASDASGLSTICVINGTAAGGGYELALAADHIMLVDDGAVGGVAAGAAAAGGSAGHRRAHPSDRQAQGAARPRRCVLHHRGRRQGQARGRVAAGRRGGAGLQARRRRWRSAPRNLPPSPIGRPTPRASRSRRCSACVRPMRSTTPLDGRALARRSAGDHHGAWPGSARAGLRRSDGRAGRRVLAAAGGARARRRHPRYPRQRARDRGDRVQVVRRPRPGARL